MSNSANDILDAICDDFGAGVVLDNRIELDIKNENGGETDTDARGATIREGGRGGAGTGATVGEREGGKVVEPAGVETGQERESVPLSQDRAFGDGLGIRESAQLQRRALIGGFDISEQQKRQMVDSAHSLFINEGTAPGIRLGMGKLLMEANRQTLLSLQIAASLNPMPASRSHGQSPVNLTVNVGGYSTDQLRQLANADRIFDVTPSSPHSAV